MNRFRAIPEQSTFRAEMQSNLHPVIAIASGIYGFIEAEVGADGGIDVAAPHRAQLALWVEDLDTGNQLRDLEMLRRLDARNYPTIEWVVRRALPLGDSRYSASGEITVHGRTCPLDAEFHLSSAHNRIAVEGDHNFDMRDFDVVPPRFFWLWMEPEMTVRIKVVARRVTA